MIKGLLYCFLPLAVVVLICACQEEAIPDTQLFESLSPKQTGVHFINNLPEDDAFNIIQYLYYYKTNTLN